MTKPSIKSLKDALSEASAPPKRKPARATALSEYDDEPTLGTRSTQSTQSIHTQLPIAPSRDFMKVANSIHRQAVPAGLFKGKCKQIYDFLYSKTRGAIVPTRSVRLTRKEIMKGADIGSTKTLFLNLRHLREVGLLNWDERVGPHEGNIYTIVLPEEAKTMGTQSTLSTESASSPKVDRVLRVESTESTHSTTTVNPITSTNSKTSSLRPEKELDDDTALAPLIQALKQANREVTGSNPSPSEADRWGELAAVLVTELKIAAARTGSVSSVPSFFAEHLRRRLFKRDKKQMEQEVQTAVETPIQQSSRAVDASECPTCKGSGWHYPDGYEAGVQKCKHLEVSKTELSNGQAPKMGAT